jgi:HEAT repeat-containing protein 5
MNERIKNTLSLLANGFNKLNASNGVAGGKFNLVKGAASSLAASANNVVTSTNISNSTNVGNSGGDSNSNSNLNENAKRNVVGGLEKPSSSQVINREIRIGVTYAYVELANLLGAQWLERNLKLYINHVLHLVNGASKAVSTHLDAVYSRKCVQFILRSIIGGMLNEKVQLQAARELIYVIEKCCQANTTNELVNQQHMLICAIYELSCILKCLNTSASILIADDRDVTSLRLVDKLLAALLYPNNGVKCVTAWCLRTLACSLPALMSPLLDTCMDRLHDRNPSDALVGYGYACAALLGAVNACPLGIPHLKPKIAFNIGEELLRTAKQSNNVTLALQKTSVGWLLLGSFMTLGSTVVRKHLPRLKKLWNSTMPSSVQELESEKKRGDLNTWQLSLESR